MTLPFENDTRAIVKKLSNRNFYANLRQNRVMILSISLVTFMIFTVFSVGLSFYQNYQMMNERVTGTKAMGLLTGLSQQQRQTLMQLHYIDTVGSQIFAGTIDTAEGSIALTYYNPSEWSHHIENTIDHLNGNLPEKENEIMLSEDALKMLELDSYYIGAKIWLSVSGTEQEFVLCGWFHDYVSLSRPAGSISGNIAAASLSGKSVNANAIVSQAFAQKHGIYDLTTFCPREFKPQLENMLKEDLKLSENQNLILIDFSSDTTSSSFYTIVGVLLGCIFIMLCGYLLIYNIACISVTKDIHFYGILKTIGTTPKQLKKVVRRQILLLSSIAIPVGLIGGSIVSIWAVPVILSTLLSGGGLGAAMEHRTTFSPVIYLFVILFSLITVSISCKKPAKEAGRVSPITAVRYTGTDDRGKGYKAKGIKGISLYQMALRNVFRNRKRAILVFLSLFMGLEVFLAVFTIFSNPNWEYSAIVDAPFDFTLSNATIQNSTVQELFDKNFLEQVDAIQGITEKELVYGVAALTDGTDPVWATYIHDKLQVSSVEQSDLISAPRLDTAGISLSLLQTLPLSAGNYDALSLDYFEKGETVYISPTENENVPQELIGQTIHIQNPQTGFSASYRIAGILKPLSMQNWKEGENFYWNIGTVRGNQAVSDYGKHRIAHVYMSTAGIEKIASLPIINQIFLNVDPQWEAQINQTLIEMQNKNSEIYLLAKSTYIETNKMSLGSILIIGTVFSLLLLVIGLTNFANTMATNIYARQREFATLESIGMTKKQILITLSIEGIAYAFFSLLLLIFAGIPLTYGLVWLVSEQFYFLTFRPPFLAVLIIALLVTIICLSIPRKTFRLISRDSITNRLKDKQ